MNNEQTELIKLTIELDKKAKKFKELIDKLEKLKKKGINPNDESLVKLGDLFQKNHDEIAEIREKLKKLK